MKAVKFILIFVVSLLSRFAIYAQKPINPTEITSFNITVNYPDYTVKTQMLKDNKKVKVIETSIYHWYSNSGQIVETTGGFDGHVLHGYYKSFYMNSNLKEEGEFSYGVKSGKWTNWNYGGKIKDVIHWKDGKKNGKYRLYDDLGNLLVEGIFKNDNLNGKFKTFKNGKLVETIKFKNGVQLIPEPKKVKEEKPKDTPPPAEKKEKKEKVKKEKVKKEKKKIEPAPKEKIS